MNIDQFAMFNKVIILNFSRVCVTLIVTRFVHRSLCRSVRDFFAFLFECAKTRVFNYGRQGEGKSGCCGAWRDGGGRGEVEGGDERGRMYLTFSVTKLVHSKI